MTRPFQIYPAYAKSLAVVATTVIFGLDWWTLSNVNISIFYACVIVVLAWTQSLRWLWGGTMATVLLAIFGLTAGNAPDEIYTWVEITNRYITACMLLVTAVFVHFSILLARQLDMNKRLLAEITERKRAEESLRKAQDELAHVSRVTTLGELGASIAHEVNQPLSGIVMNGNACLRWLAGTPPNLDEARDAAQRIIRDGNRASNVILRIRTLLKKTGIEKDRLDMNDLIQEVIVLAQGEIKLHRVALRTELADNLPLIMGDRVQLQQVMLNLILNGVEAMNTIEDRPRELIIRTQRAEGDKVLVTVQDSGTGFDPQNMEKIFDAFHTTKQGGMGMGLSISRSIIENHDGRLWASPRPGPGATLQFTVLKHQEENL